MKRDRDLEHPEIAWYRRTGYPSNAQEYDDDDEPAEVECSVCGCSMYADSAPYDPICEDCQEVLSRYEGDEPA